MINILGLKNEIKSMIIASGYSMAYVAEKLGMSRQNFSNKLSNETIKYSEILRIAEIIGYIISWEKKEWHNKLFQTSGRA